MSIKSFNVNLAETALVGDFIEPVDDFGFSITYYVLGSFDFNFSC